MSRFDPGLGRGEHATGERHDTKAAGCATPILGRLRGILVSQRRQAAALQFLFTGDWISRAQLKAWKNGTWDTGKGGSAFWPFREQAGVRGAAIPSGTIPSVTSDM